MCVVKAMFPWMALSHSMKTDSTDLLQLRYFSGPLKGVNSPVASTH